MSANCPGVSSATGGVEEEGEDAVEADVEEDVDAAAVEGLEGVVGDVEEDGALDVDSSELVVVGVANGTIP